MASCDTRRNSLHASLSFHATACMAASIGIARGVVIVLAQARIECEDTFPF
jgi:hypothetical protein